MLHWSSVTLQNIKFGTIYTFTYVQYEQKYTKISPNTLLLIQEMNLIKFYLRLGTCGHVTSEIGKDPVRTKESRLLAFEGCNPVLGGTVLIRYNKEHEVQFHQGPLNFKTFTVILFLKRGRQEVSEQSKISFEEIDLDQIQLEA